MLAAGDVPVFADDHRPADASNERGYLEHELTRRLAVDGSWVAESPTKRSRRRLPGR